MIKYKTGYFGIDTYIVDSETDKTVSYTQKDGDGKKFTRKEFKKNVWFDSFEEAKACMLLIVDTDIETCKSRIKDLEFRKEMINTFTLRECLNQI